MTVYTDVFGGANIYPSDISYSALSLTAAVALSFPEETSSQGPFLTSIIDVDSTVDPGSITLPSAVDGSNGATVLFNNTGAFPFDVLTFGGTQLVRVDPGTTWQVYLADNSTAAGVWRTFQYGVGVSAVNAGSLAGLGIIAIGSMLAQEIEVVDFSSDYTTGAPDRSRVLNWSGANGTLNLPDAGTVGNGWFIQVRNSGVGALVVDPSGALLIDGSLDKTFNPGESAAIVTDGVAFYTVGFGTSAIFAFDYTTVDISGTGNFTLNGSDLNRIAYSFTGVLTGNRTVIVPATVQQYWITNNTTGAFSLTVRTAAGTGVVISQGDSNIYYSNGADVVIATSGGVATPISIADGGTGATTAAAARINLGGTTIGIGVFTAASSAAAYAALGPVLLIDGGVF